MLCATCTLPIGADEPSIALADGTTYHAPYDLWQYDDDGKPVGEPTRLHPECPPVVEPGPPAPPQPAGRVILSQLEFTRRFTLTENVTINAVRLNPATPLSTRAQLETLRDYLQRATNVDVTDADTIMGTHAAVDVLVNNGVVQAADKDARIAAILAPAVP